jgi:hypothetical protein
LSAASRARGEVGRHLVEAVDDALPPGRTGLEVSPTVVARVGRDGPERRVEEPRIGVQLGDPALELDRVGELLPEFLLVGRVFRARRGLLGEGRPVAGLAREGGEDAQEGEDRSELQRHGGTFGIGGARLLCYNFTISKASLAAKPSVA